MTSLHIIDLKAFFMSMLTATQLRFPLLTSPTTIFCSSHPALSVAKFFLKPYFSHVNVPLQSCTQEAFKNCSNVI